MLNPWKLAPPGTFCLSGSQFPICKMGIIAIIPTSPSTVPDTTCFTKVDVEHAHVGLIYSQGNFIQLREVKQPPQSHTAGKWQRWYSCIQWTSTPTHPALWNPCCLWEPKSQSLPHHYSQASPRIPVSLGLRGWETRSWRNDQADADPLQICPLVSSLLKAFKEHCQPISQIFSSMGSTNRYYCALATEQSAG